jgi:hypothetical protein
MPWWITPDILVLAACVLLVLVFVSLVEACNRRK